MPRQAARDDEQSVDADIVALAGVAGGQPLRGYGDAAQTIFIQRPGGSYRGAALLDLDERQNLAATGDQVDLATRHAGTPGEDSPALQAQPPGGDGLRLAAARLGQLPVQSPSPSSSARA